MKSKPWIGWLIAGIGFSFVGIMYLFEKKSFTGACYLILGLSYFVLSTANYKKRNKQSKAHDTTPENIDTALLRLISQGRKIEAIKEYRTATGVGLKEAKDYVDSLSEKFI